MANIPVERERGRAIKTTSSDDRLNPAQRAALARLEPAGVSSDGGWQQRKSAQSRINILEAAVRCLAERGYSQTTTKTVAAMAGISRGAMLHHYPTKQELVEQAIAYTFYKRMVRFLDDLGTLTEKGLADDGLGVTLYWKNLHTPEHQAYIELSLAARTDEELRQTLEPKAAEFDEVQLAELSRVYPGWKDIPDELSLARDLLNVTMDGLILNQARWHESGRAELVCNLIRNVLGQIRTGRIELEDL